jgi:tRNA(adenine34) deaminase
MCAGALFWSQLSRLVYGASDPKRGFSAVPAPILHPKTEITKAVSSAACEKILKDFFERKRK